MQQQVRASNPKDFPHHKKFVDYKKNNVLATSESVALKILEIIDRPLEYQNVLLDVRQH
jgi:hypothetical protein